MTRMTWIAGALLVGLAVVVGVAYFALDPEETTVGGGGPAVHVKVDQALADEGEATASSQGCTACHSTDGSASAGPTWAGIYGTEAELDSGEVAKVNDAYLKAAIIDPNAQVRSGFSAGMPSYSGKVSDQEIAALIEYIKSLSG